MEDLFADIAAYLRTQRQLVPRRHAPGALSPLSRALRRRDTRLFNDQACPACGKQGLWQHFLYGPGGTLICHGCGWEECPF